MFTPTAELRLTRNALAFYGFTSVVAILATTPIELGPRLLLACGVTVAAVLVGLAFASLVSDVLGLAIAAAVIGGVRGVLLITLLGAPDERLRIASSIVSAVVWLGAAAVIEAGRTDYQRRYAELVREVALARASERLQAMPEVAGLQTSLAAVVDAGGADEPALRAAAEAIRWEVEHRVRPLSHRLWFSSQSLQPHVRVGRLMRDALVSFDVPAALVSGVWLVAALVGAPSLDGVQRGLVAALMSSALLFVAVLALDRLAWHRDSAFVSGCSYALASLLPVLLTTWVLPHEGLQLVVTFVFLPVALFALLLAAAAITLAARDRAELLAVVEMHLASDALLAAPELSSYLHNSLQSELTGLALQLEQAPAGSVQARDALERIAAMAQRSVADDFLAFQESPLERIHRLVEAWEGIVALDVRIDAAVNAEDARLGVLVQAIEEIALNAARHGGATRIVAAVDQEAGSLRLEVQADGRLASTDGQGMGTGWLACVAEGPVRTEQGPSGVRIRLRV